jgi:hypothetical protein
MSKMPKDAGKDGHHSEHAEHEHHAEHHPEHHASGKSRNMTPFYIIAAAAIFLAVGFVAGGAISGGIVADKNAVGTKVVTFLQDRLSSGYPGITTELAGVSDFTNASNIYEVSVKITYQGQTQTVPYYATKDGSILFTGLADLNEQLAAQGTVSESAEVPKTDKPVLDLFVWAFCPYGVQAEQMISPVFSLLGSKSEINIHYIGPVTEDKATAAGSCFAGRGLSQDEAIKTCCVTYDNAGKAVYGCALHNANEALESARQVCILDKYGKDKLWSYLDQVNDKCYPLYQDTTQLNTCWKGVASSLGLDSSYIESCSSGTKALQLLQADADLTSSKQISSSPTFMINNQRVSGGSSESIKQSICSAFNTVPSECGQTLSTAGATASGGCG